MTETLPKDPRMKTMFYDLMTMLRNRTKMFPRLHNSSSYFQIRDLSSLDMELTDQLVQRPCLI